MIAVEWRDWNAPRAVDGKLVPRQGVLLHVGVGMVPNESQQRNCAWIILARMEHDHFNSSAPADARIIKVVTLDQLTVKGVPIPFEPSSRGEP